jgi:hypothetical protein
MEIKQEEEVMKFIVDFKVNVDSKYQQSTWVNQNFTLEVEQWDVVSNIEDCIDFDIRRMCEELVANTEAYLMWYKFEIVNIGVRL